MAYIKRAMEDTFLRMNKEFPVILLTGPRQVGKTTMLQNLLQQENIGREYITLDDLTERELAKKRPKKCSFSCINRLFLLMKYSMHRNFFRTSKSTSTSIIIRAISGLQVRRFLN